ncbi:MAG: zf-HC2 domain-containing protein [Tenuifilaceae bacterium]
MNCKNYNKHFYQYLDGELPKGMAMQIEEHIKSCRNCENALGMLKNVNKLIEEEKNEFKPDPFMSARIISKLTKTETHIIEPNYSLRYLTITSLAAAGIFIGILIGSLFASNSSIFEDSSTTSAYEQLADEYMPEVENNPYNLVTVENEIPTKP